MGERVWTYLSDRLLQCHVQVEIVDMRHGDFGNMNQQGGTGNALIGDVATYYFMVHPVARKYCHLW